MGSGKVKTEEERGGERGKEEGERREGGREGRRKGGKGGNKEVYIGEWGGGRLEQRRKVGRKREGRRREEGSGIRKVR